MTPSKLGGVKMKIAVIYGTQRKSTTYNVAQQFIAQLAGGDEVKEFFLPKDAPAFCRGCFLCFDDFRKCPDYPVLQPIIEAMSEAELIILTSPVYVYHVTGQLKAFLDHFGFQWMPHQPNPAMFKKQALLIATAAGAGTRSTLKDMRDSMLFWGIARCYSFGRNVAAANWSGVSEKCKGAIAARVKSLSAKIKRDQKNLQPGLKVKALFYAMRFMQKNTRLMRQMSPTGRPMAGWGKSVRGNRTP
jgi:multimeric flavodoxin WrbA